MINITESQESIYEGAGLIGLAFILLKIMAECQTNIVNPAHGLNFQVQGAVLDNKLCGCWLVLPSPKLLLNPFKSNRN